jgi:hypothetical protein
MRVRSCVAKPRAGTSGDVVDSRVGWKRKLQAEVTTAPRLKWDGARVELQHLRCDKYSRNNLLPCCAFSLCLPYIYTLYTQPNQRRTC